MSDNQFSCGNILTDISIDKFLTHGLKSIVQGIIIGNDKNSKKIKTENKNYDGTYTCPDCKNICSYLQNAHIGFTQKKMCKSIINDMGENYTMEHLQSDIKRYLNYHKHNVMIAVVCNKCNSKYESDKGVFYFDNSLKYILDYDSDNDIELEQESLNCEIDNDSNITLDEYKEKLNQFEKFVKGKTYGEKYTKLFKDLAFKVKCEKVPQRKSYIQDYNLKTLFFKIENDKLNEIYVLYNTNNYRGIINILSTIDFDEDLIVKECNRAPKTPGGKKQNHPFSHSRAFRNKLIEYFESLDI
tara:strand:+ start:1477 stop:2373 length:897 start_codon:yes stop_codon:yes gene_type:complete